MTITTERQLTFASDKLNEKPDSLPPQACLADIADALDWAELLDTLVSDFALALANGEAQYMPTVGDLMGRAADD